MLNNLYLILEKPSRHILGRTINFIIFTMIIISIIAFFLSTVPEYFIYNNIFNLIEHITMIFFTVELVLRFIAIGQDERFQGFKGRLRYLKEPFVIIDILVLLPYYLYYFLSIDFTVLKVLRIMRIFKLLRYEQYSTFDIVLWKIIKENKEKFFVIVQLATILMLVSAPLMYFIEHDAQPEIFSSIPETLWWAIITFTTIGYGDMYPITALGKIVASFLSVLGIVFYTVPGAIFTSALLEKLNQRKNK
jgi:voltage-gated potassium channel